MAVAFGGLVDGKMGRLVVRWRHKHSKHQSVVRGCNDPAPLNIRWESVDEAVPSNAEFNVKNRPQFDMTRSGRAYRRDRQ